MAVLCAWIRPLLARRSGKIEVCAGSAPWRRPGGVHRQWQAAAQPLQRRAEPPGAVCPQAIHRHWHLPVHRTRLHQPQAFGGIAFEFFEYHVGLAADRQPPAAAAVLLGHGLGKVVDHAGPGKCCPLFVGAGFLPRSRCVGQRALPLHKPRQAGQ